MDGRPRTALDSREGLLDELLAIDDLGWSSGRGEHLLGYVRAHIVLPQVVAAGLRGPAADQAAATGWQVAWEALNGSAVREIESPWGWLWVAVRRAVRGELMGSLYLTNERNGWRARRPQGWVDLDYRFDPPVSLTRLVETGWDRPEDGPRMRLPLGRRLQEVVRTFVALGWEPRAAQAVVEAVALTAVSDGKRSAEARGWRPLATHLGLPPWQVRRVTVVLLGAPGWPGVMERLVTEGRQVLEDEGMRAAMRSTVASSWPTPVLAARRASRQGHQQPISVAS